MVNGFSEKSLIVNHIVKVVNFPGGTSERILEQLDVIRKEKPDYLIVHVATNDISYNARLLTNVKEIFNKVSKELPSTSIINRKDKTNI